LRMGGVAGDKAGGIAELQMTAAKGFLLAPFARILLAIAYVREKEMSHARELLLALQKDFPNNTLFAREIVRLDSGKSSP
jgi:predicted Zn-dependent protease